MGGISQGTLLERGAFIVACRGQQLIFLGKAVERVKLEKILE